MASGTRTRLSNGGQLSIQYGALGKGVVLSPPPPQLEVTPPGGPRGCEVWEKTRNGSKKSLMLRLQERMKNVGLAMVGSRREGRAPRHAPLP